MNSKELKAFQEENERVIKELDEYNKNKALGINVELLQAFVDYGKLKWKIKDNAHVNPIRKIIDNAEVEFQKAMKKLEIEDAPTYYREPIYEKATKVILEAALEKFNYKKESENPRAGPIVLGYLAREVADFLVAQGGKAGFQHSQMLSKLTTLRRSNISMAQQRNTELSDTTDSD